MPHGEVHPSIIEGSIERIGCLTRSRRGTPATVDDDAACATRVPERRRVVQSTWARTNILGAFARPSGPPFESTVVHVLRRTRQMSSEKNVFW